MSKATVITLSEQRALQMIETEEFHGTADEFVNSLAERRPSLWKVRNRKAAFNTAITMCRKPAFIEKYGKTIIYQRKEGKGWDARPVYLAHDAALSTPTYAGASSQMSDSQRNLAHALMHLVAVYTLEPSEDNRVQSVQLIDLLEHAVSQTFTEARIALTV